MKNDPRLYSINDAVKDLTNELDKKLDCVQGIGVGDGELFVYLSKQKLNIYEKANIPEYFKGFKVQIRRGGFIPAKT